MIAKYLFTLGWCALLAGSAFAADGLGKSIQLNQTETFTTRNVYGTCGKAYVTVTGIDAEGALQERSAFLDGQDAFASTNGYTSPSVEIVVMVGNRQKRTVMPLDEQSMVRCISTKTGKKLLIGTICTGNSPMCATANYYLVDVERITKVDTRDDCDARCINRKLGINYIKPE